MVTKAFFHLCRGVKEVLKKRLKNYYKRKKLSAANISKDVADFQYDFLVVIDFEATCQENNTNFIHEIIEFPAVLVDVPERQIVSDPFPHCVCSIFVTPSNLQSCDNHCISTSRSSVFIPNTKALTELE